MLPFTSIPLTMKTNSSGAKYILLHPYIHNQRSYSRPWLIVTVIFFLFVMAFIGSFYFTKESLICRTSEPKTITVSTAALPEAVTHSLLHYATMPNNKDDMSYSDIKRVADVLAKCSPCNFLVFGLNHEALLWKALNHNGRTEFVDENRYHAAYFEQMHPGVDVFDVLFTTQAKDMKELMASAKESGRSDCRPVQNLMFSECVIGINDLPNHVYEVDWDVILVDGPSGFAPTTPGRMTSIFTAAVLGRSKKGNSKTHVFVHDYYRDVERLYSEEFLCKENVVDELDGALAHFVLHPMEDTSASLFCQNSPSATS